MKIDKLKDFYKNKTNKKGQFIRKYQIWTPQNMENGFVNNQGRFVVYLPDHPRANKKTGYVLRSIVHYEYYYNDIVEKGFDVHHKDKNRLNDTKENLQKLSHLEHSKLHNPKGIADRIRICKICKKEFKIRQGRLNEVGANRGSYCSQDCYKKRVVSKGTKGKISDGLKKAYEEGRR